MSVDRSQDIQPVGDMPEGAAAEMEAGRSVIERISARSKDKDEVLADPADGEGVEEKSTPVVESKAEATREEPAPAAEDTGAPAPSKEDTAEDAPQEAGSGTPESYLDGKYKSKPEFETAHRHLTSKLTQETQRRAEAEKRLATLEAQMLEQTRFDGLPPDVQDQWHSLADERGRGEDGQALFYAHLDSQIAQRQAQGRQAQATRNQATESLVTWLETDERCKKHSDLIGKIIEEKPALMSALRAMEPDQVEGFAREFFEQQMELQELRDRDRTRDAEFQAKEKAIREAEREKLRANREVKRMGTEAARGSNVSMGDGEPRKKSVTERLLARHADLNTVMT